MGTYNRRTFLKQSAMAAAAAAAAQTFLPSIIGKAALGQATGAYATSHYVATRQATEPQGFDRPFFAQVKNRPEVIAHRGGEGHWPGETMYAFERAMEMGVDVLEFDVHMTRDGHLVLMHNPDVDATTDRSGQLKKMSLQEVQALDAGYRWKRGGDFPYRGIGIKVPTLDEVFAAFPRVRMNIEIKQTDPSLVQKFCELIEKHKIPKDNLLVASFSDEVMREFRDKCRGVATSTAKVELAEFLLKDRLTGGNFKPKHADVIQMVDKLNLVNAGFVERVHKHRLPVHAWTVNEPAEMRKVISAGVDGIITDYPGPLLALLGRPL